MPTMCQAWTHASQLEKQWPLVSNILPNYYCLAPQFIKLSDRTSEPHEKGNYLRRSQT